MPKAKSVRQLRRAIASLQPDRFCRDPGVWYGTQHEHWLGWLGEYDSHGAYGRDTAIERDARFAYNHIMNYQMLVWLARAAGVSSRRVQAAREVVRRKRTPGAEVSAVRELIPWELIERKLWPPMRLAKLRVQRRPV